MFPNPQSALPLPAQPNLERYKQLAKSLVKACRSGDAEAVREWSKNWVETLVKLSEIRITPHLPVSVREWIEQVAEFAWRKLISPDSGKAACTVSSAQFVIARSHGFESWPKFAAHIDELARSNSQLSRFEAAADAIVDGEIAALRQLLSEHSDLVHARSRREHRATLLHYVSANGVESYRQRTPANILEITNVLLRAGSDVDATASVYGGECTTLLLTATSVHPERAGVQEALMRLLLERGAGMDQALVKSCLANGRIKAAEFFAARGANVGPVEAAGLGRLDEVKAHFAHESANGAAEGTQAFLYSCEFGRDEVVEFFLGQGIDLGMQDVQGQTALHMAVIGGHPSTVKLLLKHHPPLEIRNSYGGTAIGQALWSAAHDADPDEYVSILEALLSAGAKLPERHAPISAKIDAWLEQHGSRRSTKDN